MDSVYGQEWFCDGHGYEVIVGIDGCRETLEKVEKIMDKYKNLHVLMMDRNVGTYITSNTIMREAKCDWLVNFGSDDIMLPHMVGDVMKFAEEHNSKFVRVMKEDFFKDGENYKVGKCSLAYGACFFRHEVFDYLGGYKGWRCSGDSDFLKRVEKFWKIDEFNEVCFRRRIHSESLTNCPEYGFGSEKREEYAKIVGNKGNYKTERQCCIPRIETVSFSEIK